MLGTTGFLMTTEGNVVHYGYIEKFIESLGEKYNIREIAFDRWGAVQMVQNLEGMGFTVVPFGQGFKDMSPPTKELMKLAWRKIAHGGHPVLRWMMDNIYVRTDPAGNIKADKEKSTEKIDGAVATIMALDRAIRCGNTNSASFTMTVAFCLFRKERDLIWVFLVECLSPEISPKTERRAAPTPFTWAAHLRQGSNRAFCHADDGSVFLCPYPGRSYGRTCLCIFTNITMTAARKKPSTIRFTDCSMMSRIRK
jgi:hypothetical protein